MNDLRPTVDERDQGIAERDQQIAERDERIAALEREIEALKQMVQSLKEQLERNSRNSGRPPSGDSPQQRGERRGKGSAGGKRGGQTGHSGSKRELLPADQVSEFKNLFPPKCESCWAVLPATFDSLAQRFQTIELPLPKPHVTEWLRHSVTCPSCDYKTQASIALIPLSPFGPRLSSVIGLVTGVYHLSRRSTVRLLSDVLGIEISLGAVEKRVSEAVKPAVVEAWNRVEEASVKHTDGTSWYQSNVLCALWTSPLRWRRYSKFSRMAGHRRWPRFPARSWAFW